MAVTTRQATSNTSPDPGQGGSAVTSPVNTGHGVSQTIDTAPASPVTRTCIWTGFAQVVGLKSTIKLQFDWAYVNAVSDAAGDGNTNLFHVQYSIDGGGAWNAAFSRTNVNGSDSGSVDLTILLTQDITQVQVRDLMRATAGATQTGRIDPSIANITLQVTTIDPIGAVVIM